MNQALTETKVDRKTNIGNSANQQLWNFGSESQYSNFPFHSVLNSLKTNKKTSVCGLVNDARSSFIEAINNAFSDSGKNHPLLFISNEDSPSAIHKTINQIQRIAGDDVLVRSFPQSHGSFLDGITESEAHFAQISEILTSWIHKKPSITVCSAKSLIQSFCPPSYFSSREVVLKKGQEINLAELSSKLVAIGYRRVDTVAEVGTFAIRGEIIDLFPSNQVSDLPWRINLFGDEIENIKPFEPWSQRSIMAREVNSITVSPLTPFALEQLQATEGSAENNKEKLSTTLDKLKELANEIDDAQGYFWLEDIRKIEQDNLTAGEWQRFIPWLQQELIGESSNPIDFFPEEGLIVVDEPNALSSKLGQIQEKSKLELQHKLDRNLLPKSQESLLNEVLSVPSKVIDSIEKKRRLELSISDFANSAISNDANNAEFINVQTGLVPQFRASVQEISKFVQQSFIEGKELWFVTSKESSETLLDSLKQELNQSTLGESSEEWNAKLESKLHFVEPFGLNRGFSLKADAAQNIEEQISGKVTERIVLTDYELFNKKSVIGKKKKAVDPNSSDFIPIDLDAIRVGDYLVHLKHGIGRFTNMKIIELDGQKREYITLEYHKGDILNVPVDQMNLLTLYKGASEGKSPKLSKLGGVDWEKTKNTVRNTVKKVAFDLLELYAKRTVEKGFAFGPDSPWQTELEDNFSYKETPDQLKAVNEIKTDMESEQIMDRLLCGDVGFGKTEVIIRAAFKAIMAGKQVAVMAPTTILAQQHFKSFKERFESFPVKIDFLTRAKTGKAKKETIEKINSGETDLVVGTHALLAKSISFKNLGLIIVDEEQKFGVNHKEKLKALKANISVLTVSATPIPRTMHMAMSGIREMSLISTPPPGRVPIKTQIAPNDLKLVRAGIVRELERGGQVFYLHNRVETIQAKALELMELVPEASYKIAHGKMSEAEISEVMEAFINHEFDVLIATSIIENGIDIPNANTMIIENADRFGLSQLYQLRGRVGRSNDPSKPGFALLLHGPVANMNEQARARLETIARYSNLGSGYQIALRDMEIRGVGNILGAEQHGKMVTVGFELYCEMLNEAITEIRQKLKLGMDSEELAKEIKAEKPLMSLEEKPVFDFKLNAYIPVDWINDDSQRMKEYQRLSEVTGLLQLTGLEDEWNDRFGKIPGPVKELIKIVKLRLLAIDAAVCGLIRPKGDFINLNSPRITFDGWKKLQELVPSWLKERIAVRLLGKESQIMVRIHDLDTKNQLDLLEELLSKLSVVV